MYNSMYMITYCIHILGEGEVSSSHLSNVDVKEALSDLSEALDCAEAREGEVEKCQHTQKQFKEKIKNKRLKLTTITEQDAPAEGEESEAEHDGYYYDNTIIEGSKDRNIELVKRILHKNSELSMFDHVEVTSQTPNYVDQPTASSSSFSDSAKPLEASELLKALNNAPPRDYPRPFHSLEFLPYNPIPKRLDMVLFPNKESPLPLYDDPYWPSKRDCLTLLAEIRAKPNYVPFTGTFITPEARGAE